MALSRSRSGLSSGSQAQRHAGALRSAQTLGINRESNVTEEDWVEVSREAHELSLRHGPNAYEYAARLASAALREGKIQESEFWRAVHAALKPR